MTRTKSGVIHTAMLLLACLILMSACSKETGTNSPPNNNVSSINNHETVSASNVANENNNKLEPYTLRFVYTGSPQRDELAVEQAMNEYLLTKINAKIDLMPIDWGPWDDKVNLMIASREKVDIIFTAQWNKHAVNVSKGAFLELDELLEQYGQGILQSLDPVFLAGAKINGKNYAVPTNKELAAQGGIIYRSDVAEELGIDMSKVKKIEDLDEVYQTIISKKPGMTPLYMKLGETFNTHYIGNFDGLGDTSIPGIILKDEDGTIVKPAYEVERYVNTLRITRQFFQKGYINKDAATNQTMNNDAISSGDVFSITSALKPGKNEELAIQTGLIGKLAQLALNEKTIATSETAGSMLAISSTSQNPVRAMMFINMLHTDPYLNNLINYGIEGKHYIKLEDNIIKSTELTKDYNPGANWMFGNQFLNYVWETEDPLKWERFKEFSQNAKLSPGLGFVFNGDAVKAEVAAVVNVDRQYQTALETGSVDVDKVLPEYRESLKAAGIEKIIKEKQAQFDQFLANK
ncbi:ABC transporter substrate-binding protein [Paenibacillus sp. FSL H8-0548]|uniref:ABC transporter substrate-binding protein n=1 Tax=Paenibacillus sp. FSL H8-0548 TaxID=1920422 RepID=UPI00096C17A9|nr:ABC transporter substrate-binding protein [Paenibacillus sp. FSL H8-0548]OMF38888.1 ABC transporter substrate-binding protein [Paenibacillus sp. FSL H8-0548]